MVQPTKQAPQKHECEGAGWRLQSKPLGLAWDLMLLPYIQTPVSYPSVSCRVLFLLAAPGCPGLQMKLPDGTSEIRTFATSTPSVPAQQGERLTLVCAAPADTSRAGVLGALRLRGVARAPGWRASEPMQLDNHITGAVLPLLRAPPPSQRQGLVPPSWLLPGALLLTASSTAGAALLDPSLPSLIATAAVGSAAAGTAITTLVLPQMSRVRAAGPHCVQAEGYTLPATLLTQLPFLRWESPLGCPIHPPWLLVRRNELSSQGGVPACLKPEP